MNVWPCLLSAMTMQTVATPRAASPAHASLATPEMAGHVQVQMVSSNHFALPLVVPCRALSLNTDHESHQFLTDYLTLRSKAGVLDSA